MSEAILAGFKRGTFEILVSYLVPGAFVTLDILMIWDLATHSRPMLLALLPSFDLVRLTIILVLSLIASFPLGLITDLLGHLWYGPSKENAVKMNAYTQSHTSSTFDQQLRLYSFHTLAKLLSREDRRTEWIDAIFYSMASPQLIARHEWTWSFFEFHRNLTLLWPPTSVLIAAYLFRYYSQPLALLLSVLAFLSIPIKVHSDDLLQFYYRTRLRAALAYLEKRNERRTRPLD
jgi:hypothetical protein